MITNLFSWFDPISRFYSLPLNFIAALLPILFLPHMYWAIPSRYFAGLNKVLLFIHNSTKTIISGPRKSVILCRIFLFIRLTNLLRLLPYVFCGSSHFTFTLAFAFPLWTVSIFYIVTIHPHRTLAHLVPQGSPTAIIFFLVIIELIRLLIRPLTLAVRLAANITAGHLLTILLNSALEHLPHLIHPYLNPLIPLINFPLLILETRVAIIQAVVFVILVTLYLREAE